MKYWFIVWKWKYEKASSLDWRVENTLYEGDHPLAFLKSLLSKRQDAGIASEYRFLWWSEVEREIFDSLKEIR